MVVSYLIVFILGLSVGSFLNCLIYRLETNQEFVFGRSSCPLCRQSLSWKDLIPILSFVFLRGRCRYCQKPISLQYPLVELATWILFTIVFWNFALESNLWLRLLYYLVISSFLIAIFVFDLKHYLIPDEIIYPAIFISVIWYFGFHLAPFYTRQTITNSRYDVFNEPLTAFLAAFLFFAIYLFSRGKGMGFGDIKLAFFMGFFLGFPRILVAIFLAFFSGALMGIILMIFKKKTLKSELPFAPFLVSGTFLALFFGQQIISCYLNFLLF